MRADGSDRVFHTIEPCFDGDSRVLVLGSFPSPLSRSSGFYYGHPQNRFWPVLAAVFGDETSPVRVPGSNEEKKIFLHRHHIALWDVLASCRIEGASDASISGEVPNDLSILLSAAPIRTIFATGSAAAALYHRYCAGRTGRPCMPLPSTSPAARGRWSMDVLVESYTAIRRAVE